MINRRFGFELEFTGITREEAVVILERFFNSTARRYTGSIDDKPYYIYKVFDALGRAWTLMRDRSIRAEVSIKPRMHEELLITSEIDEDSYKVELTTPILSYDSFPQLLDLISLLGSHGAVVNESAGIHIHVDAPENSHELVSFVRKFCQDQETIVEFSRVIPERLDYCKFFDQSFITFSMDLPDIVGLEVKDVAQLFVDKLKEGYSGERTNPEKYYALNISSILERNTLEFRMFNATLNTEEVLSILDWVSLFYYGESCRAILFETDNMVG